MPDNQLSACFIDTNIWLYAFVEGDDPAKSATARRLIHEVDPIVSTQVINEVCVNLLRRANFTEKQIGPLIKSYYEKYQVIESSKAVLITASQLRQQHSFSFWDSIILASALGAGTSILYSEDMQHGLSIEGKL